MKWEFKEAELGDMVRTNMGSYYHYAIFIGDEKLIQFGKPQISNNPDNVVVEETSVVDFLGDRFMEVAVFNAKEQKQKNKPEEIVKTAKNCLGEKGYNILTNNCEHFANRCVFNSSLSSQIDQVRKEIINKLFVPKIYIVDLKHKFKHKYKPLLLAKELKSITNKDLIKQKIQLYNLLYYVFLKNYNSKLKKNSIEKNEFGKPMIAGFEISFSHCEDMVAIGIAKSKIGIDIEYINRDLKVDKFQQYLYNNSEYDKCSVEDFYKCWGKKESIYKMLGNTQSFNPRDITTENYKTNSEIIKFNDKDFIVCWALEHYKNIEIVIMSDSKNT